MSDSMMSWAKEPKNKKYALMIILLIAVGIILTFGMPKGTSKGLGNTPVQTVIKSESGSNDQYDNYEDKLEKKLKTILTKMEGVGSVEVMVTTVSTEEKVLALNSNTTEQKTEEKDQTGGSRMVTQTQNNADVVMQSGSVPYVTKENSPQIKGVFILAEGADDPNVRAQVTEAVARVLDVPVHKISVEKKKS